MNNDYQVPRRITVLPLAILQIVASFALAVSVRIGVLHVGIFLIGVASAMFALQILACNSYWYFVSASVSVCAAFLVGGVYPFVMSAFAVPAGVLIAFMVKKKSSKMSVVAALDITYIVLFAALFLAGYLYEGYEFSVSAIIGYVSDIVEVVQESFTANIEDAVWEQMAQVYGVTTEEFLVLFDSAFEMFKLILPSILLSALGVLAYVTASFFKLGTMLANCELVLPDPRWRTLPSKASAVVFSVAYIVYSVAMMFSSSFNAVMLVSLSVVIILAPLMLLMGAKWLAGSRGKAFIIFVFVFGLLFMTMLSVVIFAFFGVREVFREHERAEKRQNPEK